MISFSTIYERLKARLAFCFPVSHTSFSTNNTPDEEGMAVFINKSDDKYLAVSDGQGGQIEFRHTPIPPPSIISEIGVRVFVDGVIRTRSVTPSFELEQTDAPANNKKWDLSAFGSSLYLRTAPDAGSTHNIMRVDRVDEYVTNIEFFGSPVAGLDAVNTNQFITLSQLNAKKATAVANVTTADATDPASTQTLANANKAKINELLAAFRTAGLITP